MDMEPIGENQKTENSTAQKETKPKKLYKLNGKEYDRADYVKLCRQEKKEKIKQRRAERGIPEPVRKDFDLNNEKVWFKNTYRQAKVQLINNAVKRMRYFRFTLEKLNKADMTNLEEKAKKKVEQKKQRCTNAEKHMESEMHMIKSWKYDEVFNMLVSEEPMDFTEAVNLSTKTGDFKFRARERIRSHPLVKPVVDKIHQKLNLFESNRTEEGKSKSSKLASKVLAQGTPESVGDKMEVNIEVQDEVQDEFQDEVSNQADESVADLNENCKTSVANEPVAIDDNPAKNVKNEPTNMPSTEHEKISENKLSTENDVEDFAEYSSDEAEETNSTKDVSESDEGGFDIEFVLPKFLSKDKDETVKESTLSERTNNFFLNEGEKYAESEDSDAGDSSETSENEPEENTTGGSFFLENDKAVNVKPNLKKETSKGKTVKDNRDGQRERKKHAKSVYGKHVEVVQKQEKNFRDRSKKGKEKRKQAEVVEQLHPSWIASKKAKMENKVHEFKGKKITFDSDSE